MWLINYTVEYAHVLSIGQQGVVKLHTYMRKTISKHTHTHVLIIPVHNTAR